MAEVEDKVLSYLEDLLKKIGEMINKNANWRELLKERQLSHEEAMAFAEKLEKIQKHPHSVVVPAAEKDLAAYLRKVITNDEQMKNRVLFMPGDNDKLAMWMDEEALNFVKTETKRFLLQSRENKGYLREVSEEDFLLGLEQEKDNDAVVIRGLSLDQYLSLTKKIYGEDTFTFVSTQHMDKNTGALTYDVAVKSRDFMNASKEGAKSDFYTAYITQQAFSNEESKEANKYEMNMKLKILNYKEKKPLYIAQMNTDGPFLKVTNEAIEVWDAGGLTKTLDRSMGVKEFATDVLKYLDEFRQPIIITQKDFEEKIKGTIKDSNNLSIEQFLKKHAETGKDDFSMIHRPINRNDDYIRAEEPAKLLSSCISKWEQQALENVADPYINKIQSEVERLFPKDIPAEYKARILSTYKKTLLNNIHSMPDKDYTAIQNATFTKIFKHLKNEYKKIEKANEDKDKENGAQYKLNKEQKELSKLNKEQLLSYELSIKDSLIYHNPEAARVMNDIKNIKNVSIKDYAMNMISNMRQLQTAYNDILAKHPEEEKYSPAVTQELNKVYNDTVGKLVQGAEKELMLIFVKDMTEKDSSGITKDLPDSLDKAICDLESLDTIHMIVDRDGNCRDIVLSAGEVNKSLDDQKIGEVMGSKDDINIEHDDILNAQNASKITKVLGEEYQDLSVRHRDDDDFTR